MYDHKLGMFPVSSVHESIKSVRKSVREDLELGWVTNLIEERKRFYLITTLLDPHTKILSFCDNKYFPSSWKTEGHEFLSMEFQSFCMEHTQGEVNHVDGQVSKPGVWDDLSVAHQWMSTSVLCQRGDRIKCIHTSTSGVQRHRPSHVVEFPRLVRMTRQYLTVSVISLSPERLFKSVGLVKSDLRGSLLDTTLIDVMWAKQAP
jgi:hypothetical protein